MAEALVDNSGQIVQPRIDMHPQEAVARLVDGDLASDGVQWSAVVTTGAPNVDVVVLTKTISQVKPGSLVEVELGLTAAFKATSVPTTNVTWKWQARNSGGTWVDLHPAVTEVAIGLTYVERTRAGYFALVANFNALPFDIRLIIQATSSGEGMAKVKNSSYVRFIYKPS